jgi:hypothetical protein
MKMAKSYPPLSEPEALLSWRPPEERGDNWDYLVRK